MAVGSRTRPPWSGDYAEVTAVVAQNDSHDCSLYGRRNVGLPLVPVCRDRLPPGTFRKSLAYTSLRIDGLEARPV